MAYKSNATRNAARLKRVEHFRARNRKWYRDHAEQAINRQHVRAALARAVADGERARGCVDCGMKDDLRGALHFDHIPGRGAKRFAIARGISGGFSPATMYAEIDKCEVRCRACHIRVTNERRVAA